MLPFKPDINIDDQNQINPTSQQLDRLPEINIVLERIRNTIEILLADSQDEIVLDQQELDHFALLTSLLEKHLSGTKAGVAPCLKLDFRGLP